MHFVGDMVPNSITERMTLLSSEQGLSCAACLHVQELVGLVRRLGASVQNFCVVGVASGF